MPLAIDASPITAICSLSNSCFMLDAKLIPKAAEIEVEECPTPKLSNSLSFISGKPLIPPNSLFV